LPALIGDDGAAFVATQFRVWTMTTCEITDLGTIQGKSPRPEGVGNSGTVTGRLINLPFRNSSAAEKVRVDVRMYTGFSARPAFS
jgi:hypothetical protein